jgi:hypothetical protein
VLREPDSNRRPPGYGPGELPTALSRDNFVINSNNQISRYKQKMKNIVSWCLVFRICRLRRPGGQ